MNADPDKATAEPNGSWASVSHRALLKRVFVRFSFLAGVGLCALTAASFLGGWGALFDLTSHFPVQYCAGLMVVCGVFVFLRKWRLAALFGAAGLVNLLQCAPLFFGGGAGGAGQTSPDLTLMSVNVLRSNRSHALVKAVIRRVSPDAFALLEVDQRWVDAFAELETDYPYSLKEPRDHNFGIAFYSRKPLRNARSVRFVRGGVLSVVSEMNVDGEAVTLVATHPVPPSSVSSTRERNEQLAAIAAFAARRETPLVVLGDLNTTPWNRYFKRLVRNGGLMDSAKGFGLQATWPGSWGGKLQRKVGAARAGAPAGSPFDNFLFRIPIDHCLHSEELETVDRIVGDYVGSDHLPLTVKLRRRKVRAE